MIETFLKFDLCKEPINSNILRLTTFINQRISKVGNNWNNSRWSLKDFEGALESLEELKGVRKELNAVWRSSIQFEEAKSSLKKLNAVWRSLKELEGAWRSLKELKILKNCVTAVSTETLRIHDISIKMVLTDKPMTEPWYIYMLMHYKIIHCTRSRCAVHNLKCETSMQTHSTWKGYWSSTRRANGTYLSHSCVHINC